MGNSRQVRKPLSNYRNRMPGRQGEPGNSDDPTVFGTLAENRELLRNHEGERAAGQVSHHPASLGYHASGYHGPQGEHSEMDYRLGIPTRGPLAGRASIEAIAIRVRAPGVSCLATSDRFTTPLAIASRRPCTDAGAFPDPAGFVSLPLSTSDEDGIRLPGRAPHGGSQG